MILDRRQTNVEQIKLLILKSFVTIDNCKFSRGFSVFVEEFFNELQFHYEFFCVDEFQDIDIDILLEMILLCLDNDDKKSGEFWKGFEFGLETTIRMLELATESEPYNPEAA